MTENIMDLNLYELIDVEQSASVKELKTAYRKKALICHPDKNPDNSRATELFCLLKEALDMLTDERERTRRPSRQIEEEFLRKQIYHQLYGIKNQNDAKVNIKWKAAKHDPENGGYNYQNLYQILFKYGDIVALVISSKNGRAIVEYKNASDAVTTAQIETGFLKNPLSLQGLWKNNCNNY